MNHASHQSDDDLSRELEAAAGGDEAAWRLIVDRYARRVFALARSRVRRP
ncbi:MAG: RNA polymerase subunit sigma, partial [Gemmatimonadetes bacterium]|nr:RNA polymerase subunit sigma [Gemmatimonadota bacterium]